MLSLLCIGSSLVASFFVSVSSKRQIRVLEFVFCFALVLRFKFSGFVFVLIVVFEPACVMSHGIKGEKFKRPHKQDRLRHFTDGFTMFATFVCCALCLHP